jgi:hypothetical protein
LALRADPVPRTRDPRTLDLFEDWQPPEVVHRFDDKRVRAANLREKMAMGVAETLKGAEIDRDAIAKAMADWLGEDVSKNLLDAYASQAREDHVISLPRMIALIHATGDVRILQMIAEMFGYSVVEDRHLAWIDYGRLSERRDEVATLRSAALRKAKAGERL